MALPFTIDQFFDTFGSYNTSTWWIIIIFYLVAIMVVFLIANKSQLNKRFTLISIILLWLWTGMVYHILFFSKINKAAYVFGIFFIIQSILVLIAYKRDISFIIKNDAKSYIGLFFIIFSLIIYPIIGYFAGHTYPNAPFLGAPCPSVIFTFGVFMLAGRSLPRYLIIIPTLWAVIATFAAINLNVPQDYMLPLSAIISIAFLFKKI